MLPFRYLPVTLALVLSLSAATVSGDVIINEILYRPAGTPEDPTLEFLELHNMGAAPVSIANWKLDKGVNFTFPNGTTIAAGGYLVVASDPAQRPGSLGPWTGSLSNSSEELRIVDALGVTKDSVTYSGEGEWGLRVRETTFNGWDWESAADDDGHSLERRNASLSTDNGQNWLPSTAPGGTPGAANSQASSDIAPVIRNLKHSPASPRSTESTVITCEVIDETPAAGITVTLHWRNASTANPPSFTAVLMVGDGSGKFSAILPPMPDKTIVEFYVSASDGNQTRTWPAATSEGQNANAVMQVDDEVFTGTDEVYRLITTAAENAAFNAVNPNSDREFNATLVTLRHAQSSIRYQTGFRIRGASSRSYQFRPLRISVPADNPIDDVKVFNLNPKWPWNQYLGMKLLQAAGLRAPDARAVELRRNGVEYTTGGSSARDYGKWVRVDHLDADFVDKHWPEDGNGNLYKKVRPDNSWAFRDGDVSAYLGDGWTKESNSAANDWSDLDTLMGTVRGIYQAHGGNGWSTAPIKGATAAELNQLGNIADLNQWIRWMAIENFMGNAETNASNGADDDYSMYRGAVSGKFEFVAHDHDTLFGLGEGARPPTSHFFDMTQSGDVLEPLLPLFGTSTVPGNLVIRENYYIALRELANTVFAEPAFSAFVDNHLGNWIPAAERTAIKDYVATRRATVESAIAADSSVTLPPYNPPAPTSISTLPSIPGAIRISEVLARNVAAHQNGTTFPDAIEIFNGSGALLDLAGMTLTDDPAIPAKFTFPAGSTVPNGGYLIVYADDDTTAPGLHTGFALDQEGDQILLYNSTTTLIDSVAFGPQVADLSISRGGAAQNVWVLTQPTLGAANGPDLAFAPVTSVRINELLSNPDYLSSDDFLELYNTSNLPVALGGVIVTDDFINYPTRHVLPPLSFIGPLDFVVLRPTGDNASPDNPSELPFKFSSFGTWAAVMGANGAPIDRFDTDTMPPDVSLGRAPDGSLTLAAFGLPTSIPSPGTTNAPPPPAVLALLNQLRITEVLYRPNTLEFVELQNIGNTALDISGVRFTSGITYTFPQGTILGPRSIIVVCKDRAAFQAQYGTALPLAPGQFSGTLDNSGETIGIQPFTPWNVNILRFRYEPTWYAETSLDHSLCIDDVVGTLPRNWDEKESWFPSDAPLGTPGVGPAPQITSPLTATGIMGDAFAYQITAKRFAESYSASGLPTGLSIDAGSGLISGVPTQMGQFSVTISAANSFGSDEETLVLTITATGPLAGFEWSGAGAAQIQGEAFTATLRAIDAGGRTIATFSSAAQTSVKTAGGLLVFTEVGMRSPTPDYFELQNVGGAALDTSGWFVVTKAGSVTDDPSADLPATWALPGTVTAGQIIGATDSGTLAPTETPYGTGIDFPNGGEPGWVMLVDGSGTVRDFVAWGYTADEIAGIAFTSNGHNLSVGSHWTGNGTAVTPAGQSLFRGGASDTNQATDWSLGTTPNPRGTQNAELTVPWTSAFTAVPATGVGDINLVNGVWSGPITVNALVPAAELHAVIPTYPVVRSDPFAVISTNSNRPPSFTKGSAPVVNEDSGTWTILNWATAISGGPGSESSQTVTFLVTNDSPTLFSTAPAISPNGTLTFTLASHAFGIATVTVRARDNGGTANGGQDTSAPQTFTITVRSVNDAPTITRGPNVSVPQTAGPQSIPWAIGISAGAPNEADQIVNVLVSTNNSSLFSTQPTIALDGTLTFTPNVAASGNATVSVSVVDDGGTANGGIDSFTVFPPFVISITSVNFPPTFQSGGDVIAGADASYSQVWATQVAPGPTSESGQTVQFQIIGNTNSAIFLGQPSLAANGVLTFTPQGIAGKSTITVILRDNGANNPSTGDDNTSDPVQFLIQLTSVSSAAGKYRGLVEASGPPSHARSGLIELNVNPKGSYSGKLKLEGKSYRVAGSFDSAGQGSFGRNGPALPLGKTGLTLALQTDLAAENHTVTGQILSGTDPFATLSADRDFYHKKLKPAPASVLDPLIDKGNYTVAFVAQEAPNGGLEASQFPQGDGWATLRVSSGGTLAIRGQFADGARFSYSSGLSSNHQFPLYVPAYKKSGSILGKLSIGGDEHKTISSPGLRWFRPIQLSRRPPPQYPQGWPNGITLGVDGSARLLVTEPTALPMGNALLELAGGNPPVGSFTQAFAIGTKNRVTMTPPINSKASVKLKSNGAWSGSFVNSGTGKRTTLQGVILRHRNSGTGFFLGGSESGRATIRPTP